MLERVYIASAFRNREYATAFMDKLSTLRPVTFTSSWVTETYTPLLPVTDPHRHSFNADVAVKDMGEILDADTIIVLTENCEEVPGGMHFEMGFAYGIGKRIIVIGPRVHVFCSLPLIFWYPRAAAFFATMGVPGE